VRLRLLTLVVVAGLALLAWRTFRAQLPAAERGRRLAETTGCFGCHGAEGTHGTANPGRLDRSVPTFRSDVMMYAKTRAEIREWITQGSTARRRESRTWREQRELGTLRMPGFGRRLSAAAIDDLVAFVEAQSMTSDSLADSLVRRGFDRADQLGCDGCHGPGGRFARRNPGSLKGYIPSWDGRDFPELVRDSTEFREWVEHGVSRRFDANPAAKFFLKRAVLKMPAFERHLDPGDVPALWAWVEYARRVNAN